MGVMKIILSKAKVKMNSIPLRKIPGIAGSDKKNLNEIDFSILKGHPRMLALVPESVLI